MFRKLSLPFIALFLLPCLLLAQDGKLRGKVTDKESGEPLIGANITVEGTGLGAASDINGEYIILSVPPGVYAIKASYIGYAGYTISNIRVNANITTTVDMALSSSAIQIQAVEIVAERPLIQRNTTNTVRFTTQDEIKSLPYRGVQSIIALNAGVVQQDGVLHIRGGRTGEVGFYVDGASVTNPLFAAGARQGVSIIQEAIEEFQLQSGGYTAEFGGASSGVARTTVRTGGSQYKFTLDYQTDDFAKPGSKFLGTTAFGFRNGVATVSGPIPSLPRATFFIAGQHNYTRNRDVMFLTPFRFDSLVTDAYDSRGAGVALPGPYEIKENYLYKNWQNTNTVQGTFLVDLAPIKVRVTSSFSDDRLPVGHGWTGDAIFANGWDNYFWQVERLTDTKSLFGNARITHVLNPTTFYEVGFSYYKRWTRTYDNDFGDDFLKYSDSLAARDIGRLIDGSTQFYQSRWVGPRPYSTVDAFNFTHPYAAVNAYNKNQQTSFGVTIDLTSQVTPSWELKAGGRLETWVMRSFAVGSISGLNEFMARSGKTYSDSAIALNPYVARERDVQYSRQGAINYYGYDIFGNEVSSGIDGPRKPTFASAYIQNKLEFRDLILNIGARYEYFDQNVQTVEDYMNPAWDANLNYFASPDDQLVNTKPANLILPRVSFSFPVTDLTVFYAMYGKYAQLPELNRLYSGSRYLAGRISPSTRQGYELADNPTGSGFLVRPERTTQYEMGIRQSISDNFALTFTGFYKDVRDQIQQKRILNQAGVPIFVAYRNEDFSTIKGLELTLELRRTNRLAARVNYTLSDARGSASTPASSRIAVSDDGTARFPNFINPLDFNQTHRGTIFVDYRWAKGDGGPLLEGLGLNVVLSFNSGHNYTQILEPLNLGQASVWNIGVRPLIDPRTRNPVEPINSSTTPWVFNIDLNFSKVFYLGATTVELYANVLNLFNTKQVINVFTNTGTATDDGWLRSTLSTAYKAVPRYTEFYQAINIENRYAYIGATGNDVYGTPRQIRVGLKLEI
jgi:hypothetical protein